MPRKYELGQRSATMAATREKILLATVALHKEQGIVATSYKDIAKRADVGLGTVYHHFPAPDDLVRACGGRVMEMSAPPQPDVFEGLRSRQQRLDRLVAEVFAWYERYPHWRRALCDADKLEVLAAGVKRRETFLIDLVRRALGPEAKPRLVATVRAVVDYEVYRSLREAGHSTEDAAEAIATLLSSGVTAVSSSAGKHTGKGSR